MSSSRRRGPEEIRPDNRGFLLLHCSSVFSRVRMKPPALETSAAPAATSHSFFGVKVNVVSASPADTSASLYATEPIGRMLNGAPRNCSHSPRLTSLRLASASAPTRVSRMLGEAGFPLYLTPRSTQAIKISFVL